jgi:SAM-dependent methyltransferase
MAKIDLGTGNYPCKGWISHDFKKHSDYIDIAFDLNKIPWPLKDNEYEIVRAFDVLEHLDDVVKTMDEIWRILKPDGFFVCKVCGDQNPNLWVDPTHKRGFNLRSMEFFDPTTELGKQGNYLTDKKWKIISSEKKRENPHFRMEPIK